MATGFFKGKKVLVTGGTGLIGRPVVERLVAAKAQVRVASLDDPSRAPDHVEFVPLDLRRFENCLEACRGMDFVLHLAGIKGSPAMATKKPASFYVPTILVNTNMMEAARQCGAKRILFTSTIGVYAPAEIFREDDVWKTFPSENDKFAGWAKRMGELQAEAYRIEFGMENICIVRPANVYGPYDNFDPENAMVIPSLIRRVLDGERPLQVWGDGSAVRDIVHADDVAEGILHVFQKGETRPVNLGSGVGVSVRRVVEIILENVKDPPDVIWDTSKPTGDKIRLMDISRAKSIGWEPKIPIEKGVRDTLAWYRDHRNHADWRYNVFRKTGLL